MGYGAGLVGLVAIKVLAPGYYAAQDIRTPVRIAVVVLVVTQLLNIAFVPLLQHAGLALSIGVGALINAAWLLAGLHRRGSWRPQPGWGVFLLQVFAASALLAVFLMWAAGAFAWTAMPDAKLVRIGLVTVMVTAAVALYFGAAWAAGLRFRALLRR